MRSPVDGDLGNPSSSLPIDKQIIRLSELASQIREAIQMNAPQLDKSNLGRSLDDLTQLVGALNRISRMVSKIEDERHNLFSLVSISHVINSSLELNEVLRIVMDTIISLTGAERGFLMLRDQTGDMSIQIARNLERETLETSEFAISRSVVNQVVTKGQPVLTTNAQQDPRFDNQESVITLNLRSILCVPLKVKDELTGVIYADNRIRTGLFTDTELNLLTAFANQAAVVIENARLFESVRSTLAEVTELKNLMGDVFSSIISGVITLDAQDRITLANRSAESILGFAEADLLGQNIQDIFPSISSDFAYYLSFVRKTNRQIIGREFQLTLPNKGMVTLSFNLAPLKDADQNAQGIAIVLDDLTEKRKLEAQRLLFERMVSPAIIEKINTNELKLGGTRAQITTLFADIRGFTGFSEHNDPEQLVSVLNCYLGAATEAVLNHQGTIDKFIGDAVMAFFNAPIPQSDHALRAVNAALAIKKAILAVHKTLPPEFRLSFGIGIHYGEAVLGLIGTEKRMDYTAIGDSVNTAKRIQENAAAGQILISATVFQQVSDQVKVRPVVPVQAKGKSQPVLVYELLALKN